MIYFLIALLWLSPLYVWRFELFGIPTNFLMVAVGVVWVIFGIWLIRRRAFSEFWGSVRSLDKKLLIPLGLFVMAGGISLFVGGVDRAKLGQFLVWFIQPISLFFIIRYVRQLSESSRIVFVHSVYVFLAITGVLALVQYFTLTTLPSAWWGNAAEPKRAIAWFAHPNGFSLFIAPLIAWLLPDVVLRLAKWRQQPNLLLVMGWILGSLGLFLSLSRGAWLGVILAGVVFLVLSANKKYLLGGAMIALVVAGTVVAVPNLRYRVILPFKGEKSSVARFSLWQTGWKMIAASPIMGQGLNGFNYQWNKYNTDPNLEHYNFSHNILLNFWVDTGLLGMLSFIWIIGYGVWHGIRKRRSPYFFGLALLLITLVAHGLIDIPYFKNDLALVFWLVLGLLL